MQSAAEPFQPHLPPTQTHAHTPPAADHPPPQPRQRAQPHHRVPGPMHPRPGWQGRAAAGASCLVVHPCSLHVGGKGHSLLLVLVTGSACPGRPVHTQRGEAHAAARVIWLRTSVCVDPHPHSHRVWEARTHACMYACMHVRTHACPHTSAQSMARTCSHLPQVSTPAVPVSLQYVVDSHDPHNRFPDAKEVLYGTDTGEGVCMGLGGAHRPLWES